MHVKLTMLFAFCVLLPGQVLAASPAASSPVSEAPSPAPVDGAAPTAPGQPSALDASQPPALDDAALTAAGLGRAPQIFQPSQAINVDKPVTFPSNI